MFKSGIGYSSVSRTRIDVEDSPTFNYTCPVAVDSSLPFSCTINQDEGTKSMLNAVWTRTSGVNDNFTYTTPGRKIIAYNFQSIDFFRMMARIIFRGADPRYFGVGAMFSGVASPSGDELGNLSESGTFKIRTAYFDHPGIVTDLEAYVITTASTTVTFSVSSQNFSADF